MIAEVDRLFTKMNELIDPKAYPPHVVPIKERIKGTAFFPGGSGLYLKGRELHGARFPFGGVMVLGHNFDAEIGFKKSYDNGEEDLNSPVVSECCVETANACFSVRTGRTVEVWQNHRTGNYTHSAT
ncbi:MAG: hypothetical protein ACR2NN_04205 [Bryobacteraceae bacterium]